MTLWKNTKCKLAILKSMISYMGHGYSQSCTHMQSSNFLGYVRLIFHNNMYKITIICTSTKNIYTYITCKWSLSTFSSSRMSSAHSRQFITTTLHLQQLKFYYKKKTLRTFTYDEIQTFMTTNTCFHQVE